MEAATKQRLEELLAKADLQAADQQVTSALRTNANDADALVFRARLTAFKGELDAALVVNERALKIDPKHQEGRATKGALLLEKGRAAEAKALLSALVQESSAPASAHFNLARCLRAEDDVASARAQLEAAIGKEPHNGFMRFALAEVYAELGEPDKALPLLEESLREDPGFGDAWLVLAHVQIGLGHEGDAIKNLEEAIKHCPTHGGVRELLGTTLLLAGEVDKATAHFQQLATQYPDDPDTLANLGLCFAAKGSFAESEGVYREALKLDKDNVHVKTQLASLLEMHESKTAFDEAVRLLKEAVRSPDAGWEPHNDLGRILTTRNEVLDLVRGIDMLERARKKAGGAPEPDLNLAIAYARVGRPEPMGEMCRAVLSNPSATDEMKAEAERLLKEVGA